MIKTMRRKPITVHNLFDNLSNTSCTGHRTDFGWGIVLSTDYANNSF